MSKYVNFENECSEKDVDLQRFAPSSRDDQRFVITKMPQAYSSRSCHGKSDDFSSKTKTVCKNTDLSMFLDQCKVLFVGGSCCGKTSLIKRFTSTKFTREYKPTTGPDLDSEYINVLGVDYSLGLWDIPAHGHFKFVARTHFKDSNVIIAVFDLSRPSTLVSASKLMREAIEVNPKTDTVRILVGTKRDAISRKMLEGLEQHAIHLAQELNSEYFSVSAKDGTEVNNLFKRLTALAFDRSIVKLVTPPDYYDVKNSISSELSWQLSRVSLSHAQVFFLQSSEHSRSRRIPQA